MSIKSSTPLLALALLLAAFTALAQPLTTQPLDRVVAVVDEEVILRSELDRAIGGILSQYAGRTEQLPPQDVLERQVLDRIILMRLQAQRALDTGIRVSEVEVDGTIANLAQQNGMTLEQLRYSLAQDGLSYSEFRETMREDLLIQQLQQRFTQSRVSVSDSEIDNMLARSNRDERVELHLGHILVSVPDGADSETLRTGQEKAEGILELIRNGSMDFNAAAIRYSNAPNALDGGDLGWRDANEIPPAFVDLVSRLSPGQVTDAVRGPAGFHILKLHDRRTGTPRMAEEFKARHILIPVDELTSDTQARAEAERLRQRIVEGEDFADLARQFSRDHTTAPLGGDMGWFPVDGYGGAVANVLTSLANGELSEPFRTDVGWHVMQRIDTRIQDVTEVFERRQAAEIIRSRKAEEEYDRFLRQMRGEAYIENRLSLGGP